LIVTAYAGTTMPQVAPTFAANECEQLRGMMHEQDGQNGKMPCKGRLPNCITDIGCIFWSPAGAGSHARRHDGVVVGDLRQHLRRIARAHHQARSRPSHLPRLNRSGPIFIGTLLFRSTIQFLTPSAGVAPASELTA
jgi:hypothetical protein